MLPRTRKPLPRRPRHPRKAAATARRNLGIPNAAPAAAASAAEPSMEEQQPLDPEVLQALLLPLPEPKLQEKPRQPMMTRSHPSKGQEKEGGLQPSTFSSNW